MNTLNKMIELYRQMENPTVPESIKQFFEASTEFNLDYADLEEAFLLGYDHAVKSMIQPLFDHGESLLEKCPEECEALAKKAESDVEH